MTPWLPGKRNLITDVGGIQVGNATDRAIKTGVTALICDHPMAASVQVLGGAPGTRETDLLEPDKTVAGVDALVLSGGSAFGLDAASGIQDYMKSIGRGFAVGAHRVPIVPAAILFDLINGGDKNWSHNPYHALGRAACVTASQEFRLGSIGAGTGALTADLKGGLGSASTVMGEHDVTVGALVAVNALGTATVAGSRHFWAAPFEIGDEFGALGLPHPLPASSSDLRIKMREQQNTTIGIIATDAKLSKAECKRLSIAAHDGFARSLWPSHTPLDGDLIFGLSTGEKTVNDSLDFLIDLSAAAAATMARAVARAVYEATPQEGDPLPCWSIRR